MTTPDEKDAQPVGASSTGEVPPFPATKLSSLEECDVYRAELGGSVLPERQALERSLIQPSEVFDVEGHCIVCKKTVPFAADLHFAFEMPDGTKIPNWRERMICPSCGLNNRIRAAVHFLLAEGNVNKDSRIYMTEQHTGFHKAMEPFCAQVIGSEYLEDGTARGQTNARNYRHEDITNLTFDDEAFDVVTSFEVLEHVPDFKAGLTELARVLRPGGTMLITVPYRLDLAQTLVRARHRDDGSIEHLEEPEYHGDPLKKDGILCYYHFGWDFLDAMREAGLKDPAAYLYWSHDYGYLGGVQIMLGAKK